MVDLLVIGDTYTNMEFDVVGVKRCSGTRQLAQIVAIEFLREINDLLGVGSNGVAITQSRQESEAKALAQISTSRAERNIIRNQELAGTLLDSETLKELTFISLTLGGDNVPVVNLKITSVASETTTISIPT